MQKYVIDSKLPAMTISTKRTYSVIVLVETYYLREYFAIIWYYLALKQSSAYCTLACDILGMLTYTYDGLSFFDT
ncbi:hypothetical protein AGMMS50222_01230 [Endomicrobiia bacterium]|nr:hypothetical protein AGMMS49531_01770 [Endomicrobiia bacterium]GHT63823.1 hypothetical protein AGMMS49556_00910 [Endomicrobiia bacterium]GHT69673.1 hypothetical protein AGMMS49950_02880 [Endomicrobiia bacterium]GHT73547.1 hypothetical protein AGMMS50222_01230 [Endomicrobiia bacterium]